MRSKANDIKRHFQSSNDAQIFDLICCQIPDLDLVVGGHSHTFLYNGPVPSREQAAGPYPTYVTVNDTDKVVPVVQASAYTKYMGHLRLNFDLDTGDLLSPVQGGLSPTQVCYERSFINHIWLG